jgi:hypothetical protein
VAVRNFERKINALRDARKFKRKERRDIDAVPCGAENGGILTLDECDLVALAKGPWYCASFMSPSGGYLFL